MSGEWYAQRFGRLVARLSAEFVDSESDELVEYTLLDRSGGRCRGKMLHLFCGDWLSIREMSKGDEATQVYELSPVSR